MVRTQDYWVDGEHRTPLNLTTNRTYVFELSHDSTKGAPFLLSNSSNGSHASGGTYALYTSLQIYNVTTFQFSPAVQDAFRRAASGVSTMVSISDNQVSISRFGGSNPVTVHFALDTALSDPNRDVGLTIARDLQAYLNSSTFLTMLNLQAGGLVQVSKAVPS